MIFPSSCHFPVISCKVCMCLCVCIAAHATLPIAGKMAILIASPPGQLKLYIKIRTVHGERTKINIGSLLLHVSVCVCVYTISSVSVRFLANILEAFRELMFDTIQLIINIELTFSAPFSALRPRPNSINLRADL